MGSSAQQFTDAVVVCEHIEQGVKSGRIFAPTEKRGFERKEVHHVEDGYRGRKNPSQNYHTPSQITNIKPEPHNFKAKNPNWKLPKGSRTITSITATPEWDVPKAIKHRSYSSRTFGICAATLS